MSLRTYMRIVGVTLLILGLLGFSSYPPDPPPAENIMHLGVGVLFAYFGFFTRDIGATRLFVGGMGVLLLISKAYLFIIRWLSGEPPFGGLTHVVCLVIGISSILVVRYLRE